MRKLFLIGHQYTADLRALSHCGSAPDFPHRTPSPVVDLAEIEGGRVLQATYGAVPARVDRCECFGTVVPGVSGVLLMHTAGDAVHNVERCDLCAKYVSDDDAADVLRALGWRIERETLEPDTDYDDRPPSYLLVLARPVSAPANRHAAYLERLLNSWPVSTVGTDVEINGGDVVEWLGTLREELLSELATYRPAD